MFSIQRILCLFIMLTCIFSVPAYADGTHPQGIKLDGTVGAAGKIDLPGPNYQIKSEYGKQSGSNLFHSFQQFNIHSGESATFSGPASVKNIISRVTGGSASWIDGKLASTIPGADLYFLNPFGIMFGSNATLDLSGSFHVSTADYLKMGDNERFYSTPIENEVLSVAAPSAFGFLGTPADISFQGSKISVLPGKEIIIAGGNLTLEKASIVAPGGTIGIASVLSAGEVNRSETGLHLSSFDTLGKISILGDPEDIMGQEYALHGLDVSGDPSGLVVVKGKDLEVASAKIFSMNFGATAGKGIDIELSGKLAIHGMASIVSETIGTGQGGAVKVVAKNIEAKSCGQIASDSLGPGQGGDLIVKADKIVLSGLSDFETGLSGDLEIIARLPSGLFTNSLGQGEGAGNGGKLNVYVSHLLINDMAEINASTAGYGDSGSINIEADRLEITGGGSLVSMCAASFGNGGAINIKANEIILSNVGTIKSSAFGLGDAGSIFLMAEKIDITGGGNISASTLGFGEASSIKVVSKNVHLSGSANENMNYVFDVYDSWLGGGFSALGMTVKDFVGPSSINAAVIGEGAKSSGKIEIEAQNIDVRDGARISSENRGSGDAGGINIRADNTIKLLNNSMLTTEAEKAINNDELNGKIIIYVGKMLYLNESKVASSVRGGEGKGGDIDIRKPEFVVLNRSEIRADAYGGPGGNIHITADHFLKSFESIVSASSALGIDGTIEIESPEEDVTSHLTILPGNFFDATRWVSTPCEARSGETESRFEVRTHIAHPVPFGD